MTLAVTPPKFNLPKAVGSGPIIATFMLKRRLSAENHQLAAMVTPIVAERLIYSWEKQANELSGSRLEFLHQDLYAFLKLSPGVDRHLVVKRIKLTAACESIFARYAVGQDGSLNREGARLPFELSYFNLTEVMRFVFESALLNHEVYTKTIGDTITDKIRCFTKISDHKLIVIIVNISELIHQGGWGKVFPAYDLTTGESLVWKVAHPKYKSANKRRQQIASALLRQEVKALQTPLPCLPGPPTLTLLEQDYNAYALHRYAGDLGDLMKKENLTQQIRLNLVSNVLKSYITYIKGVYLIGDVSPYNIYYEEIGLNSYKISFGDLSGFYTRPSKKNSLKTGVFARAFYCPVDYENCKNAIKNKNPCKFIEAFEKNEYFALASVSFFVLTKGAHPYTEILTERPFKDFPYVWNSFNSAALNGYSEELQTALSKALAPMAKERISLEELLDAVEKDYLKAS